MLVTNRWGIAGLKSRRCQTVRRLRQKCLHRCRAGGRGCAEEKGRPRGGVPGRTRSTVTWRIRAGCLCLFDSSAIKPRSNLNFFQSSDRQAEHSPRCPLRTRESDNGLVSVRMQPAHTHPSELTMIPPQVQRSVTINCITVTTCLNLSPGCGDVLTKPKLDKHRAVCHTSFDCIDCSKRFESPADYKGHTSCISEAEKYQKSLYNGGVRKHTILLSAANFTGSRKQGGNERNGRNQRSRQQGGGRQWGNNRPQWQQRPQGTGANDTPLGTPVRMSPVNDIPVVEENTQNTPAVEVSKKRKAEPEATESNVSFYSTLRLACPDDGQDTSEPTKKKKKQKNGDGATGDTVSAVRTPRVSRNVPET